MGIINDMLDILVGLIFDAFQSPPQEFLAVVGTGDDADLRFSFSVHMLVILPDSLLAISICFSHINNNELKLYVK